MPPLCTAGYGLATLQFSFFYGAFYLFTINTVCIAYASVVISQMLNFPIRATNISEIRKKRINQGLSSILIVIILPVSIWVIVWLKMRNLSLMLKNTPNM